MFITIEGIDGCGKSTQARLLAERLTDDACPVVWTKEPGGWRGGEALRTLLLEGCLAHPLSELLLFLADRGEHVRQVIHPALAAGQIVLCERYSDSTLAYQSWGRGIASERIEDLLRWADFPVPDITFLIDLPTEEACVRLRRRGTPDRLEREGRTFLDRVRKGFSVLAAREPHRIVALDGMKPVGEIADEMYCFVRTKCPQQENGEHGDRRRP